MSICPAAPFTLKRALLASAERPTSPVHGVPRVPAVPQLLDAPAATKKNGLPAPKTRFMTEGSTVIALTAGFISAVLLSGTVRMTVCAAPEVSSHIRLACTGVALRPKSAAIAIATKSCFLEGFLILLTIAASSFHYVGPCKNTILRSPLQQILCRI